MWLGTKKFINGTVANYNSKRGYDRLCKANGEVRTCTDDLLKNGTHYHRSQEPLPMRQIQPALEKIIHESKDKGRVEKNWQKVQARKEAHG